MAGHSVDGVGVNNVDGDDGNDGAGGHVGAIVVEDEDGGGEEEEGCDVVAFGMMIIVEDNEVGW